MNAHRTRPAGHPALLALLCLLLVGLLAVTPALAHKASDAYLRLDVDGAAAQGQIDIALRDVDYALGLDADADGAITWGELRSQHEALAAWVAPALRLQRGGQPCPLQVGALQVDAHSDGAYAVLALSGRCAAPSGPVELGYRLLFDADAQHRGLLRLRVDGGGAQTAVFAPDQAQQAFPAEGPSGWAAFRQYTVEGVWHIWLGFDHVLFLLSLLLPAVLVARRQPHPAPGESRWRWQGVARLGEAGRSVLGVVTAFTVAHSITLSLATLGWIALPSRLVESVIALSVVLAALNNLWPVVPGGRRWLAAFGFGLIHGFGFATVLGELGLPEHALAVALLGFNLGVEAGQLAIVAVFLPLAYRAREGVFYRRVVFAGGSCLTAGLATVWLVERAFGLELLGLA